MTDRPDYLLAGRAPELERLRLQSTVWEPAGRAVLARLPRVAGAQALDIGCGAMGWLRALSQWAGDGGHVTGTDVEDRMLDAARAFTADAGLANAAIVRDDLFASALPAASFDLVHARFQLAPLGRADEQLDAYRRLVRPGGTLVLEEPDSGSWRVHPDAPACARLIALIVDGFRSAGGDFDAGRTLPSRLRERGLEPSVDAHVVALDPGHPYLALPLQFAASLRPRLATLAGDAALDALLRDAEAELARPGTWGTTFTLVQAWATVPA